MTAIAPRATLTRIPPLSRIYGLGSVYAKTLRDSRLAIIIVSGILAAVTLGGGAAYKEYATEAARLDFAKLVQSLPPVMQGLYGNPRPVHLETLGGLISFKNMTSVAMMAAIWSILALSATLGAEARRGSLELVAVTPRGLRRIALEKLFAHITAMTIVMTVVVLSAWLACQIFAVLPGDQLSAEGAIGFGLWVGLIGLASGSVAFALAPLVGRASAAGIAGAVLIIGDFLNGYRDAIPAIGDWGNLTWFGWTFRHQALASQYDWPSLALVAAVAAVFFAIGVEAFARRDMGNTVALPWPGMPQATLGLSGPASRVAGWASDETSGRLEMLLSTPMQRRRWAVASGLGLFAAIAVMTVLFAIGIGVGTALGGGDPVPTMTGSVVLGLYASAVAGVGLAVGGLFRTSLAGEAAAAVVVLMFLIDLVAPALKAPDWVTQLALTSHFGMPLIGEWDSSGVIASLVIAVAGLLLAGWGMSRRDVSV